MAWVDGKAFWLFLPALTNVFIRGEASEGCASLGEVVGHQAGLQGLFPVLMGVLVLWLHGGFLQGAVHAFHLAIGPGMVDLS
jgi:hypothetical protein